MNRNNISQDTTRAIWDVYYWVRVPQSQMTSVEYLKQMGTPLTGDPGVDKEVWNQLITRQMVIADMVDLHKGGALIKIVHQPDVLKIYRALEAHLDLWLNYLQAGQNVGIAPMDDLWAMDRFAHEIYDHAKWHLTPEALPDFFGAQTKGALGITRQTFFKPGVRPPVDETPCESKAPEPPKRQTLGEFLKNSVAQSSSRWRVS